MSASFKNLSIFVDSRWKVKYNFSRKKLGASVIPHFYVILTGQSISETIFIIQGHFQGQKDYFKVK